MPKGEFEPKRGDTHSGVRLVKWMDDEALIVDVDDSADFRVDEIGELVAKS